METMFVEARKKIDAGKIKLNALDNLPNKIGLITTVQYINTLDEIKKYFEKKGKKVFLSKGNLAGHRGQVLGCDVRAAEKLKNKVDAFLFVGQSLFHALQVALLGKKVFSFEPETGALKKTNDNDILKFRAKKKAALMKFLGADKVGIIVSTKPGQERLDEAIRIKNKLEKKGKKAFIFVTDTINIRELENFGCDAWLNTACPALMMEPDVLNMADYRNI